jgi:MinD-like ATPase involved in chromosome partitioning or flagellar assembly
VIIISIQGESEYLKKAMVAGAREYLVKPLGSEEMSNTIRTVYRQQCLRMGKYAGAPAVRPASPIGVPPEYQSYRPAGDITFNQSQFSQGNRPFSEPLYYEPSHTQPQENRHSQPQREFVSPAPFWQQPVESPSTYAARQPETHPVAFGQEKRMYTGTPEIIRHPENMSALDEPSLQEQILAKYRQQMQEKEQTKHGEHLISQKMTGDEHIPGAVKQHTSKHEYVETEPMPAAYSYEPQTFTWDTPQSRLGQTWDAKPQQTAGTSEPNLEEAGEAKNFEPPIQPTEKALHPKVDQEVKGNVHQLPQRSEIRMETKNEPASEKRENVIVRQEKAPVIDDKPLGFVTLVFSGKGGVGKTTIATNMAVVLAQHEKKRVALLDYDLQFGDISVILNLSDGKNIADMVKDEGELTTEILEDYMIRHFSGVDILSAPLFPQDAEYITADHTEKILQILRKNYDHIIVDTAGSFDEVNLRAMDLADRIILVTTRDIVTIKNTRTSLNILESLNYRDKVRVLLNKSDQDLGVDLADLEKGLEIIVAHQINGDEKALVQSINKGVPVVISQSNADISKAFKKLCERLIHSRRGGNGEKENKGIITRMFSL